MREYYNNKTQDKNLQKFIIKFLTKVIYVVLIMLIILSSIMLIQLQLHPDETPSILGMKMFCIISGSMSPEIKIDDIIVVKQVGINEIQPNDIICFKIDDETITHRIINAKTDENNELHYITKGDANNVEDEFKVKYKDLEGKYIFKIPKLGKIIILLQNKFTLITILIILIILYLVENHKTGKKEKRKAQIKEHANSFKKENK